ncbi:hypothetical protein SAY87_025758 [Trapa incisa]|uniref:Uncharacterized protein n=1 Tax=Trapa incisa TaxID=236973 RepID=A0AAN7JCJ5_9MYRT|nr:hypothetical protein SAY87_025758 [Trapa incisa]
MDKRERRSMDGRRDYTEERRTEALSFELFNLVQGVVVGGHVGVIHLVESHHHRVPGLGVLINRHHRPHILVPVGLLPQDLDLYTDTHTGTTSQSHHRKL